ncbi:MAG: glycoside hydrolase family 2 protein [Clostridia bacterium]|nr:glycoside hydrolase family 2 protein [Clostridia bacterium]
MRNIINLNEGWLFEKGATAIGENAVTVTLPHTWNAQDGQDGGNDYFRGSCVYQKKIAKADLPAAERYYLEIRGANSSADVSVDGKQLCHHDGGYSTWRVDLTDALQDESDITIVVDNAPNDHVYPQMADFTFYGGLYRDVNLVCVSSTHFDLDYFGAPGLKVTPEVTGADAKVELEAYVTGHNGETLRYVVLDGEGNVVAQEETAETKVTLAIPGVHLWNGRKDPYLYKAEASILRDGEVIDNVALRFGCRTFSIDPERGFILNGEEYPLRGVSRHQDRLGVGNALLPCHHEEDIDLIMEVGATTIRLAHYQHDQYFYDLCDEKGLVLWAEIPYISNHLPKGRENTISQMKELVSQNYHHASIFVWGLSNEITMGGAKDPDLLENHHILNDLVHDMDKTRLTTMACVSMCDMDEPYVQIPDVVSYNHYFGWYGGDTSMNGPWFDKFHAKYPEKPIGVSEYGCEALNWHTSNPTQGDYTEEYQAYYHEELIKQLFTRPYIWATHVWNMFDFGADARAEGGENGQNHKGLVTMDRKYKKDSFYAYKAWLSDDPFVHLCGKRYIDRVEDVTKVTVYSNQPEVELLVNGQSIGKKTAEDHFFYFDVPNVGESQIVAVAGDLRDEGTIRKVDEMNQDYVLKEKGAILNWFDVEAPEGRFSLNDKISDILSTFRGKLWFAKVGLKMKKMMSGGGKKDEKDEKKEGMKVAGFKMSEGIMQMMGGFTVLRLTSLMGMANVSFTKEDLLAMNKQLNRIKKPKK